MSLIACVCKESDLQSLHNLIRAFFSHMVHLWSMDFVCMLQSCLGMYLLPGSTANGKDEK